MGTDFEDAVKDGRVKLSSSEQLGKPDKVVTPKTEKIAEKNPEIETPKSVRVLRSRKISLD